MVEGGCNVSSIASSSQLKEYRFQQGNFLHQLYINDYSITINECSFHEEFFSPKWGNHINFLVNIDQYQNPELLYFPNFSCAPFSLFLIFYFHFHFVFFSSSSSFTVAV